MSSMNIESAKKTVPLDGHSFPKNGFFLRLYCILVNKDKSFPHINSLRSN